MKPLGWPGDLGRLHVASSRFYDFFRPIPPERAVATEATQAGHCSRWLPGTGCAVPLRLAEPVAPPTAAHPTLDVHGRPIIPVTYRSCGLQVGRAGVGDPRHLPVTGVALKARARRHGAGGHGVLGLRAAPGPTGPSALLREAC